MKSWSQDRKIQIHGCFLLRICISASEECEQALVSQGLMDHINKIMNILFYQPAVLSEEDKVYFNGELLSENSKKLEIIESEVKLRKKVLEKKLESEISMEEKKGKGR